MARIAGVDLPNKAVKIALTYIYGIGRVSAEEICKKTNIDPEVRINTLSLSKTNGIVCYFPKYNNI